MRVRPTTTASGAKRLRGLGHRRAACVLGALLAGAVASPARAQSSAAHDAADPTTAGLAAERHGDLERACDLFRTAYEEDPRASSLLNLALAELKAKRSLHALAHLRAYVDRSDADPGKRVVVTERLIPKAYAMTSHIDVKSAPDATFAIDGEAATVETPGVLDVDPGSHRVTATRLGVAVVAVVDAQAGTVVVASFPPPTALLPAAPPPAAPSVPPIVTSVRASPVESAPPDAPPHRSTSSARLPATLVIGGVGVATLGAGVLFSALLASKNSHVAALGNQLRPDGCFEPPPQNVGPCADLKNSLGTANTYRDAARDLYIAGGAVVAGAIVTYVVWPRSRDHAARITPTIDPVGRSLGLSGVF